MTPERYRSAYLRSDEWRSRATRVKELAGWRCERCGRTPPERHLCVAHHLTYRNVGFELDEELACLCRRCHWRIHGTARLDPCELLGVEPWAAAMRGLWGSPVEREYAPSLSEVAA